MKCGAGKVVLFATPGSAPQRVFKGGRRFMEPTPPLKTRWAELSYSSKRDESSGPLAREKN